MAGNEKRKCPAKADASGIESASAPASGIHCGNQYLDPLAQPAIAARWFTLPNLFYLLPVPALVAILSLCQWRCLHDPASHTLSFIMTLGLVFLALAGLGSASGRISSRRTYPLAGRCASPKPGFMLVGALLIIPVILVYTFWSYYVFAEKYSMGRVITDATTCMETFDVACHHLGRQRRRWPA